MLGIYNYGEFKQLVKINNTSISFEVSCPKVKADRRVQGIYTDFQTTDEVYIFRNYFPKPQDLVIDQIHTMLFEVYCAAVKTGLMGE